MRTLLLVTSALMMLIAMAISLFVIGALARGPDAQKFQLVSQVLIGTTFCLPVSWACGYIFARREIADKNRPNVVRHLTNLPFYAVSVQGILLVLLLSFGAR